MAVSIEEKQKSLYIALIRYSSDTQSLREKALDHLVLIGLQDVIESKAIRAGDLKKIIGKGIGSSGIRVDYVNEALLRLIDQGLVGTYNKKYRSVFFITDSGSEEVGKIGIASNEIVGPCIERMLIDFDCSNNKDVIAHASKVFIINCFVEYGQVMAKSMVSDYKVGDISTYINAEVSFNKATLNLALNEDERSSLYARCIGFLKSPDKRDQEVKFLLTQAYYLANVLEIGDGDFDPLAESTFRDAVVYLDSNVIFESLIINDDDNTIDDIVRLSNKLNITLTVTSETIDEINRVLDSKVRVIEKVLSSTIPELYSKNNDKIFSTFLSAREEDNSLTAREFIESIRDVKQRLIDKGISFIDTDLSQEVDQRELIDATKIVKDIALEERSLKKSINVARHDALHLLLVNKNRENSINSWFLTKDSTLNGVSKSIAGKKSLIFSMGTFLQSISPFVEGVEESSMYHLFSKVLEDKSSMQSVGNLFELSELKIIGEYHQDVMASNPEQLTLAFDYVKSTLLSDKEITDRNQHKVSLELKKFLQKSSEEQKEALENEALRQRDIAREAKSKLSEQNEIGLGLKSDNDRLSDTLSSVQKQAKSDWIKKVISRFLLMLLGTSISAVFWGLDSQIAKFIFQNWPTSYFSDANLIEMYLRLLGSLLFAILAFPFAFSFEGHYKIWLLTILVIPALYFSKLISVGVLADIETYLGIGGLIALLLSLILSRRDGRE